MAVLIVFINIRSEEYLNGDTLTLVVLACPDDDGELPVDVLVSLYLFDQVLSEAGEEGSMASVKDT